MQPVHNWELQAMTRLFHRVSNELFWVSAKISQFGDMYHDFLIIALLHLQYCAETISSVDREGGSHFRRGPAFYLKHIFGNYSPFMFQSYQRLGHVR